MKPLASVLFCAIAATLLTAASGYQVNYGSNQDITEWSTCRNVANNSPTGKAIFVPTNTSTEWSAFYTNGAPGVTIANCGCAVTAGSQTYSTAGTYTFTIPCHNTLTVTLWGAGAGGGGMNASGSAQTASTAGTLSTWDGGNASGHPEAGGGAKASTSLGSTSAGGSIYNCSSGSAGGSVGSGAGGDSGSGTGHGAAVTAIAANTKVPGNNATAAGGVAEVRPSMPASAASLHRTWRAVRVVAEEAVTA